MTSPAPVSISDPDPIPAEIAAARGTRPGRLGRVLAGDLDAIVLMAMRKEPERRYASAEQLADDLRRHLAGRPVLARGDAMVYRAVKFVRRHPAATAAAVAVMLAVVAVIVGTTWGLVRARRERERDLDLAEASSRQARRAVDQFFSRVSEDRLLNQPWQQPLRKALLQDARRFYEGSLAERAGDPALGAEVARARSRLARITAETGSPAEAADQYRQAIALWDDVLGAHPGHPEYQADLAHTLNGQVAVLMRLKGRRPEALEACRRALKLIEAAAASQPTSNPLRHLMGSVLRNTAQVQFDEGRPREAIVTLGACWRSRGNWPRRIRARSMPGSPWPGRMACCRRSSRSSPTDWSRRWPPRSRPLTRSRRSPASTPSWPTRLTCWRPTWATWPSSSRWPASWTRRCKTVRRAIEVFERLDRSYPGVPNYRGGLAAAYNMISDLHRRRLEPAESIAFADKARPLLERLVAEHPEDTYARIDLARCHNNIGRMRQQSGEPAEALRSFQRAVDLLEGLPELEPRDRYSLACNLALCIPMIGAPQGRKASATPRP